MPFLAGLDWIKRLTEPANQKRVHGTPKHLHADLYARVMVRYHFLKWVNSDGSLQVTNGARLPPEEYPAIQWILAKSGSKDTPSEFG